MHGDKEVIAILRSVTLFVTGTVCTGIVIMVLFMIFI